MINWLETIRNKKFCIPPQSKAATMSEMMRLCVSSGVSSHWHPAVPLQFFECASRYEKFFVTEPALIQPVLEAFLGEPGMKNGHARVRVEIILNLIFEIAYIFRSIFPKCIRFWKLNFEIISVYENIIWNNFLFENEDKIGKNSHFENKTRIWNYFTLINKIYYDFQFMK